MKGTRLCYSEQSEESGITWCARWQKYTQRCFASLNMTDTVVETLAADRNAK